MKNYGLNRKYLEEKTLYFLVKIQYYMLQRFSKHKNMRFFYKQMYEKHFLHKSSIPLFRSQQQNYAIPKDKHCIPVCIVTSDLILRENIDQLKKGLVTLLKNNYSHKFFGLSKSIDEITKDIEIMDDTLTRWYSSINVGRFDFENCGALSNYVNYFDLHIRAVNSSYLAVETYIYFNEDYLSHLQKMIDADIATAKTYIMRGFRHNKKTSGGKRTLSIGEYNKAMQKSDAIYESITSLKWRYYIELQKYFPTIIHNLNVAPPSILFYRTNIDYEDKSATCFWDSLGIRSSDGQFVDDSQKMFFITNLSGRYERQSCNDMIYIFHDKKLKLLPIYQTPESQVVYEFEEVYAQHFFRFIHLEMLNHIFAKKFVSYKLKLNKIKLKKRQLHNMLKLRYAFECDIDKYSRYVADDIWHDSEQRIGDLFGGQMYEQRIDYRYITNVAIAAKKINEQIEVLTNEFENKTSIAKHLSEYKNELRNRILNFWMFVFAATTLVLLIFPDWATTIANFLRDLAANIKEFFIELF